MNLIKVLTIILMVLFVTSCANVVDVQECLPNDPGGFWWGLWNGMTAGFAFFYSLFNDSIAVYDVNNTGGWYDFGFLLGAGAFSSSTVSVNTSTRRRRRR